jgi:hypothetical protein
VHAAERDIPVSIDLHLIEVKPCVVERNVPVPGPLK